MAKADDGNDTRRLRRLIKGIRVAMLTTMAPDGSLRSRPMEPAQRRFEGELWFFVASNAPVAAEVREHGRVSVIYVDQRDDVYVSIVGTASIVTDRDRVQELWRPRLKKWFPEGKKDPSLALLRVQVESAEHWDRKEGHQVRLTGFDRPRATAAEATQESRRSDGPDGTPAPVPGSGAQG